MIFSLSSCGIEERFYSAENYMLELPYKDDFRILQLNDIHLGNKDNRALHYDFLNLTIEDADADLIVLNGDIFTYADRATAREFFSYIDSWGVPWTMSFGNHDEQCYFSVEWLTNQLNNYGSNCMFKDIQDDNVFGNCNFAINLMDGKEIAAELIIMDSNRYSFSDYWGYDYIKPDQIDWYEGIVKAASEKNGGRVNSLLFFHIPFPEFQDAWDSAENGDPDAILEYGGMGEDVSCPEYNSGLFDRILQLGSTKAVFVGHDHLNDSRIIYKGVTLCYGINSTDRIYCDYDKIGGMVITVGRSGELGYEYIYHSYDELEK